jgi:hypothetical protein
MLGDHRFVERIHGLRAIEGDRGDMAFYLKIYKSKGEGYTEFFFGEPEFAAF